MFRKKAFRKQKLNYLNNDQESVISPGCSLPRINQVSEISVSGLRLPPKNGSALYTVLMAQFCFQGFFPVFGNPGGTWSQSALMHVDTHFILVTGYSGFIY